jgi:hypothetical protein
MLSVIRLPSSQSASIATTAAEIPRRSAILTALLAVLLFSVSFAGAQSGAGRISGYVLDPSGSSVAGAHIEIDSAGRVRVAATTGSDGTFSVNLPAAAKYTVRVDAKGFVPVTRMLQISADTSNITLRLEKVAALDQEILRLPILRRR